jgi:hypothetical protein
MSKHLGAIEPDVPDGKTAPRILVVDDDPSVLEARDQSTS